MVFYIFPLHVSPYFQRHLSALTLDASRYSEEGKPNRVTSDCDYVKFFYYYMTLSLTTLQCRKRTRVLWGFIVTLVVPNRPLGLESFDVLAIKVKG